MKYLQKKTAINEDGEAYQKGYILELTKLEIQHIILSLNLSQEMDDDINLFWKDHRSLANKFSQLSYLADKGLTNYEVDEIE